MFQRLRRIGFAAWAGALFLWILCAFLLPETDGGIFPYRLHVVLTGSMEPVIEAGSLVLTAARSDSAELEKGDILAFLADRFGERIVILHRFSHTERNEAGELVYRTHPEGTETLDPYETKREDILGVYVWHLPRAGKLFLFLRSGFGLAWICQALAILLAKAFVEARWKEKEKQNA